MFYVYVLYSEQFQKIYIGFTSDLKARFDSHNSLSKKGYTLRFRPWIILHSEEFSTKSQAMKREKELKSFKGREFIWALVSRKFSDSSGG